MNIKEKFVSLHQSLIQLAHSDGFVDRDRLSRLEQIASMCSTQLGVARVSIWQLNASRDEIQCELLYCQKNKSVENGLILHKQDFPIYFKAIFESRLIDANNALLDPRTSEFASSYLEPLNIKSMLDAPIFCQGKLYGVLCIEHTQEFRNWDIAEMSYAASVADTISLINEHQSWMATKATLELLDQCDSLTGLENRRFFQQRLDKDLQDHKKSPHTRALVLWGLDFFTELNDKHGSKNADYVLTTLSKRFEEFALKERLHLARVGGDTFGFWAPEISDETQLEKLVAHIQILAKKAIPLTTKDAIDINGSIGVLTYPQQGLEMASPIRCAEVAMSQAKTNTRGSVAYFSADWMSQLKTQQSLEEELLEAFEKNQLRAYYQPIMNAETREFAGMEALVRWQHPSKGLIPPFDFLPLVSKLGLMSRLGEFMLRQACMDILALRASGINVNWVSVNLSADQLYDSALVGKIEGLLREFDISASIIELEIIEELISQDSDLVRSQIEAIANLGIRLSIDDFGTGFSSLSRLKHLPVSKLKIDKSFVDGLPSSTDDQCIARSIIGLARGMNLSLVAEGVETPQQEGWLVEQGCDFLQGYLYSKPIDFESLRKLLAEKTTKSISTEGSYSLEVKGRVLELRAEGTWNNEITNHFFDEIHRQLDLMGEGEIATLVDTTTWKPSTQEVQNKLKKEIQKISGIRVAVSAYVTGDSELAAYQIELITPNYKDHQKEYFTDKKAATQWLSENGFKVS